MKRIGMLAALVLVLAGGLRVDAADAPKDYTKESAQERTARMAWFNEARFGMFIHWGLYAVPAGEWKGREVDGVGEWIMNRAKIPLAEYRELVKQFNPAAYNPAEWARIAKNAGMKYVVITSKHHDGFCLWDSKLTDYDVASTPYGRDLLKPLAEAVRAEGLRMCFYHSIMDWQHPDYGVLPSWDKDRTGWRGNMDAYVTYLKGQLRELNETCGPVGIFWFDGEWESAWTHERGVDLYNYCRSLQPDAIVNNRVDKGRKGMVGMNAEGDFAGDYGTPEQEIPPRGFPEGVSWESCMTMNDTWGYKKSDANWKSSADLVRKLVDVASKGGNLLLNVGPMADGRFPPAIVERLADMGRWMSVNGESIYGTSATPFKRLPWRCTRKPGKLYVHVFERPADGRIVLPGLKQEIAGARLLAGGPALATGREGRAATVLLPEALPDAADTVVEIAVAGLPEAEDLGLAQMPDGVIELDAADAKIQGTALRFDAGGNHLAAWSNDTDTAGWTFAVTKPGAFDVSVEYACEKKSAGGLFAVTFVDQSAAGTTEATGNWNRFKKVPLGRLTISEAGEWTVSVKGRKRAGTDLLMNLRAVVLTPAKP